MKKSIIVLIIGILVLTLAGCRRQNSYDITIGVVGFVGEIPTLVAFDKGFFEEEGLNVTFKQNAAGKDTYNDIIEGTVDIGACAQTPIMYEAFKRNDFRILASITTSGNLSGIVGRADSGIASASDLEGKKIGMYVGTASDFLLDKYIDYHNLDKSTLDIVDLTPSELVNEISAGTIDAMISWEPFVFYSLQELGDNAVNLPVENLNTMAWLSLASEEFVDENPEIIEKYLRAINKAEEYVNSNKEEAQEIFIRYSDSDVVFTEYVFDIAVYELVLSEAIITILERQAQWAIDTGVVSYTEVPDFMAIIYTDGLKSVSPESVTIIE